MKPKSLQNQMLELFTQGDVDKMEELLISSLHQHRDRTIGTLESLLETSEGKFRLKVLEILITDGSPDLISLYINAIQNEKLQLYPY